MSDEQHTRTCPSCGNKIPADQDTCFICGEIMRAPEPYHKYAAGDEYDRIERIRTKTYDSRKIFYAFMIAGFLVCIIGLISLYKMGFWINKDGVYSSDDLMPYYRNKCIDEGIQYYEKDFKYTNTFTVEGNRFTWYIYVKINSREYLNSTRTGTIDFRGNKAIIYFDHTNKRTEGKYSPDKTLTLMPDIETREYYGINTMTFELQ